MDPLSRANRGETPRGFCSLSPLWDDYPSFGRDARSVYPGNAVGLFFHLFIR